MELIATASDDGCVHVWEGGDEGSKNSVATFEVGCPVTSVAWSADGSTVYAGALDNEIHVCPSLLYTSHFQLPLCFLGLRLAQTSRSLCPDRTHRHSHLPLPLPEWQLPPLAFLLFQRHHPRRAPLRAQPVARAPRAQRCTSRLREYATERGVEQGRRRWARCGRWGGSDSVYLGCGKRQDLV